MRTKQPYSLPKEDLLPADVAYARLGQATHDLLDNPALMKELQQLNPRAHMLLLIALGALRELGKALEVQP